MLVLPLFSQILPQNGKKSNKILKITVVPQTSLWSTFSVVQFEWQILCLFGDTH